MRELFSALHAQLQAGGEAMLATIVQHRGSVPRGLGTQMLVTREGRLAGTVGGGTCEQEMIRAGQAMLAERKSGAYACAPHSVSGEACGGDITVYFQYIAPGDAGWTALCEAMLARMARRQGGWLVLRLDGGAPALLSGERIPVCGDGPEGAAALCQPFARRVGDVLALPLEVGERAVIFGAGHCAQALSPLLASVGFRVTVYDERAELATAALFPQAERVICAPFEELDGQAALMPQDYVVSMASTHEADLRVLRQVLQGEHAYVGMLGGGPKIRYIRGRLLESGVPQTRVESVHTPIGLEIGAVTPAEIAVSIAAQMVMERAKNREETGRYPAQ